MSDTFFLVFGIICSLIGLLFVFIHFSLTLSCRTKVTATVTGLETDSTPVRGSKVYSYRPKFSYTVNGVTYSGVATFSTNIKDKYSVNDSLEILVSNKNPENYRFRGRFGSLIGGIIVLAIGVLFVVLYFI